MAQVFLEPRAFTCTPSSLLNSTPCLQCLSEKELWAAMVGILALALGKDFNAALNESACFTCMSDKQLFQSLVTLAGNTLLGERNTAQDVIDQMHCLVCASKHQLMAASLYLLCEGFTFTAEPQET